MHGEASPGEEFRHRTRWLLPLRMLLGGLIITVLTGGAVATAGLLQVKSIARDLHSFGHRAKLEPDTVTQAAPGKAQTLLLVGSDHRFGDAGSDARSDTLMLVRLDPNQGVVSVLSVPRDLAVQIPGRGLAKINEAYSLGGLDLTTRTIKTLLSTPGQPFRVNHAVATTFPGFVQAIDHLHCVYVDVDRRYYHSNAGLPVSQRWSEIDLRAGYQRLCGNDALSYVRFRHQDNDLVRAARQQGFLRAAKDQLRHEGLLRNLKPLVRIFAKATETDADLQSSRGLLRLAELAVFSSSRPVREIHFPATLVAHSAATTATGALQTGAASLGDYVTTTPAQLQAVVREFMHPPKQKPVGTRAPTRRSVTRHGASGLKSGLSAVRQLAKPARSRRRTRMPVYAPAVVTTGTTFPASTTQAPNPRRYVLTDQSGTRHAAYRMVMAQDASRQYNGQYWGVQGTTWQTPPILAPAHQTRRIGGRTFSLYTDGGKLRLVAWRTPTAVYWVSNTLSLGLSNRQMLGIAGSLTQVRPR
jgi:LCP family protein required for cell wall assembly